MSNLKTSNESSGFKGGYRPFANYSRRVTEKASASGKGRGKQGKRGKANVSLAGTRGKKAVVSVGRTGPLNVRREERKMTPDEKGPEGICLR